jgi:hypothetical protein
MPCLYDNTLILDIQLRVPRACIIVFTVPIMTRVNDVCLKKSADTYLINLKRVV